MSEDDGGEEFRALLYLTRLGEAVRAAPRWREQVAALDAAVGAARRYRAQGMSFDKMALALGLPVAEVRQRIDAAAAKAVPHYAPPETTHLSTERVIDGGASAQSMSTDSRISLSQSSSSSQPASQYAENWIGTSRRRLSAKGHASGVLVVSGDSRPGGNHFGPDVQVVRRVMSSARLECWELACPEPHEVKSKIAACQPAVLHLAAHHEYSAVAFGGGDQDTLWIEHEEVVELVRDVESPPKLVVLNVCTSSLIATAIVSDETAVIAWPDETDDEVSAIFSAAFYQALTARLDVADALKAGRIMISARTAIAGLPRLYGSPASPWQSLR
ncbi:CHAT domain-containing protein [Nonomuraea wenchangensis]